MKKALLSVSNKEGIVDFAKKLINLDFEIISTGGTSKLLKENNINIINIEDFTNFPEMLDGRVKTLHPSIHAGILAKRNSKEHMDTLKKFNISEINLVVCNFYPFKETIEKEGATFEDAIENIDIGGPSMIRSASKNSDSVTVIVDNSDFDIVLNEYKEFGDTRLKTRRYLQAKAFSYTASYDSLISNYLWKKQNVEYPDTLNLTYKKKQNLRYGENSHQSAEYYEKLIKNPSDITNGKILNGKELSYNNIRDINSCVDVLKDFKEYTTCVAVKHTNPCGIGVGDNILQAFNRAYDADSISIFGGIIGFNKIIELDTAKLLHEMFLEIIIAPKFSEEAFSLLSKKKNVRLIELDMNLKNIYKEHNFVSVSGGMLMQDEDTYQEKEEDFQFVTLKNPTQDEIKALLFNNKVVKHVKSNAIVVGGEYQTFGIGAGQMNRIGAARIALEQAGDRAKGAVLASDAYFPMIDTVELAAEYGISAIIQPGGSLRDNEVIETCNKLGIAMVFSGKRHFKHI